MLNWTSDPPTMPGVYCWTENGRYAIWRLVPRFDDQLIAEDVSVSALLKKPATNYLPVSEYSGQWFGPLPEPSGPYW